MKYSQSDYPIGATWAYVDEQGSRGSVWLAERHNSGFEVWRWSFCYSDGSGNKFDWCISKAAAVSECSVKFKDRRTSKKPRFKRMLSSDQNAQERDATEADSSKKLGAKNN